MFKKKNIVITGASQGLGQAMAMLLAKHEANLVLCARSEKNLQSVKENILNNYPQTKIKILALDICEKENNKILIEESLKFLGSIDIFIANAGKSMWSRFSDVDNPTELLDLIKLNFMSVVYASYFSLEHLRKSKGSFLAISSIQGVLPVPYHSGYVASKHALNGFIDTLRLEEPDIRFLLAMPSWIAGTNIRSNALVSHKQDSIKVNTKHKKNTISKEECAKIILDALNNKKDHIFIPYKYRFIPMIRIFFRKLVDKIIANKTNSQLK
jgi:short-subunit dehydrogenase